jgi:hypothetical protein
VSSSMLVALTVWLIILTPIPTACVWPGLLLPNTMLSFIAEGSKFLIFDIALCQNEVWFPSGIDSLPEQADSCELGSSAYFGIAAGVMHLIALISICLKTPKKRSIDPSYGIPQVAPQSSIDRSYVFRENNRDGPRRDVVLAQDPSLLDEDIYTEGPSPANNSLLLKSVEGMEQDYTSQDDSSDPVEELTNTSPAFSFNDESPPPRISESRIAALSKMDLSACNGVEVSQQRVIEDLLSELDTSLAEERYE